MVAHEIEPYHLISPPLTFQFENLIIPVMVLNSKLIYMEGY